MRFSDPTELSTSVQDNTRVKTLKREQENDDEEEQKAKRIKLCPEDQNKRSSITKSEKEGEWQNVFQAQIGQKI